MLRHHGEHGVRHLRGESRRDDIAHVGQDGGSSINDLADEVLHFGHAAALAVVPVAFSMAVAICSAKAGRLSVGP